LKKYWLLIVIAIVMTASIGTFYIQSAFATNHKPVFTIEKIDGDEKEVESLLLTGFYYNELTYMGEKFEISLEETKYFEDSSFFERIGGVYDSPRIKQLQKEYRHFMRGKYYGVNAYFENEDYVAYADVSYKNPYAISSELKFSIAVLDKQTNKINSFHHLVPNSGDFWYLNVLNVQVIDSQLKVITQNDMKESNRKETHLYTFDFVKNALLNDETILSAENKTDEHIELRTLHVDDPTSERANLVLVKTNTTVSEDGYMEEVTKEELVVYDIASNTSKTINLENLSEYGYPEYVEGSNVYFVDNDENGTQKIAIYDLASEQIVTDFDVDFPDSETMWSIGFNDGKLYFVDSFIDFEKPAHVTVVDLEDGGILFKGEIKSTDQKGTAEIYNIEFK